MKLVFGNERYVAEVSLKVDPEEAQVSTAELAALLPAVATLSAALTRTLRAVSSPKDEHGATPAGERSSLVITSCPESTWARVRRPRPPRGIRARVLHLVTPVQRDLASR